LASSSTADLAARLDDRFRLLTAGNRTALPRHQTLRAVLDWSFGLLSADEQALLRILSVFAGGWTLDAVEAVCSSSRLQAAGVSDLLARLASKSLVQVEDTPETPSRYRLLETVRHYAAQQLREQGEETTAREQHMRWCVALVERVEPTLYGPDRRVSISLLETSTTIFAWLSDGARARAETLMRPCGCQPDSGGSGRRVDTGLKGVPGSRPCSRAKAARRRFGFEPCGDWATSP